ncbi:hypothetical protein RHMOL_Rhmol01G0368800 [Rhododendron molle]|uniref:Uncharacterized protein n=1 Tax=Rhododendron molle TaxID=49168 RepID=A0ACC0QAZ0_RHOML|nr:hypothetical protein RHMOL_Rhmol01G0368800 [Rhododendron molle]
MGGVYRKPYDLLENVIAEWNFECVEASQMTLAAPMIYEPYYSWLQRITLGREETLMATKNDSWPREITLGRGILLLATGNYSWPRGITRPRVILRGQE